MAIHAVRLEVVLVMNEMDGSAEESADIAWQLVEETLKRHVDGEVVVTVQDYEEVEDIYA